MSNFKFVDGNEKPYYIKTVICVSTKDADLFQTFLKDRKKMKKQEYKRKKKNLVTYFTFVSAVLTSSECFNMGRDFKGFKSDVSI